MTNKKKSIEEINCAYDSSSWFYDLRGFFILTFAYRSSLWNQVSYFSKNIKGKHLEAAVGSGSLFKMILLWFGFKKNTYDVIYGFDYADSMLAGAKKRFKNYQNVIIEKGDAANLSYDSNFFDSVSIANSIHCLPEVEESISELVRVTKPQGTIAMNVLLYPKGSSYLDKISNKINKWGKKKGILVTPFSENQIYNLIQSQKVKIIFREIRGNSLNITLQKEDTENTVI